MLRGISSLLTPELLHALASMGHGGSIAIVDANFPAAATARRLLHLPGVGTPGEIAPSVRDFNAILSHHQVRPKAIEHHAFYRAAESAFAVLRTGERPFYNNILLRKGVIAPETT